MIRINLIYDRKAIERGKVKSEVVMCGLLSFAVAVVISVAWMNKNDMIEKLIQDKSSIQNKKDGLIQISKKIKNFGNTKKKLGNIIKAITSLTDLKKGPTRIFDELNKQLSDEVWLTSISEGSGNIKIDGFSFTDPGIATFMNNLKSAEYFKDVELLSINQNKISGDTVKKFSLNIILAEKT